ncbi:MAG: hypothetical protein RMJ44_06740 [Cytophagales bacterium]|nr:hypothetical protein [Bernardetiaceae bacterium]MDW8210768.1 hypothetical protein [Cytophagales bacterium]
MAASQRYTIFIANIQIFAMILGKKKINPNRLPFLQAQILQKIYFDISQDQKTTLEALAEITDYPQESKILHNCIKNENFCTTVASFKI